MDGESNGDVLLGKKKMMMERDWRSKGRVLREVKPGE